MALRTNSKVVRERIQEFIRESVDVEEFEGLKHSFPEVARFVMDSFEFAVKGRRPIYNMQEYFEDWLQGLPFGLGNHYVGCYKNAIDILGDILEETEEERNRFSQEQAEHLLASLMYRELLKGIAIYDRTKR